MGPRPRFEDLGEGVDLYATSADVLGERLRGGDDFVQWTLRFGCILADAQEQTRAALTTVARWLLLANGEFPLSRDELSDQVLDLGCFDLAAALSRLIHAEPCLDEIATAIEIGRLVISLPPRRARRAALAR